MAADQLSNINFALKEHYSTKNGGGPVEMYAANGEAWSMIEKGASPRFKGNKTAKIPVTSYLPPNGGANFDRAFAGAGADSLGEQFLTVGGEHWNHLVLDGETIDYGTAEAIVGGTDSVMFKSVQVANAWHRGMSWLTWHDGTGKIAKGDGLYDVAGDTITFKNSNSARQFNIGDQIVLINPATALDANGQAVPRAGTLTVIARGEGTIQLGANVNTIVGAVNTDYVSKYAYFGSKIIIPGIFSWIPITRSAANASKFGVDRSILPNELAGSRVLIDSSMSPYQIIGKMGSVLKKDAGMLDPNAEYTLFVPAGEIDALMSECSKRSYQVMPGVQTTQNADKMQIGTSVFTVSIPTLRARPIQIVSDAYLHDPEVSADDDRTYALLDMTNFKFECARSGIGWKRYANSSLLTQRDGKDEYFGSYGARGALLCHSPAKNVIASTRAND